MRATQPQRNETEIGAPIFFVLFGLIFLVVVFLATQIAAVKNNNNNNKSKTPGKRNLHRCVAYLEHTDPGHKIHRTQVVGIKVNIKKTHPCVQTKERERERRAVAVGVRRFSSAAV